MCDRLPRAQSRRGVHGRRMEILDIRHTLVQTRIVQTDTTNRNRILLQPFQQRCRGHHHRPARMPTRTRDMRRRRQQSLITMGMLRRSQVQDMRIHQNEFCEEQGGLIRTTRVCPERSRIQTADQTPSTAGCRQIQVVRPYHQRMIHTRIASRTSKLTPSDRGSVMQRPIHVAIAILSQTLMTFTASF